MEERILTIEEGIKIQEEQIAQWAKVLKPEIAQALLEWAQSTNHLANDGYDIRRGSSLDCFVGAVRNNSIEDATKVLTFL